MSKILSPGDKITLTVKSDIYKGTYESTVLAQENGYLTIDMPYDQGKLVLLSAGNIIDIFCSTIDLTFKGELVSRGFSPQPYLTIRLPYSIIQASNKKRPQVITVTSGKGGVGKTSIVINLAISLAKHNKKVFVIDADLGTANIDILLNIQPKYTLNHIVKQEKNLRDIIVEGPGGIFLIPGGSGIQNMADMNEVELSRIIDSLQLLEELADIIIIDTGAGLSKNVINFVISADEVMIVTTPEPHSITDAYAIIKVLDEQPQQIHPKLIINRVESVTEGQTVGNRIKSAVNRFLSINITYFGYILEDPSVGKAIRKLSPFVLTNPSSSASHCIDIIAQKILEPSTKFTELKIHSSFLKKFKELFSR